MIIPIKANKRLVFVFLLIGLIISNAFFAFTAYKFSRGMKEQSKERLASEEQFGKQNAQLQDNYVKLQKDFAALKKELEDVSVDRDNLASQTSGLMVERKRASELDAALENARKDIKSLQEKNEGILEQNLKLKEEKQDLETIQKQLLKEKEQLQEELDATGVKKLTKTNESLKIENTKLENNLKQAQSEIKKLKENESQLKEKTEQLSKDAQKFNQAYAEAVKKNKLLEKKVIEKPAKFAEIARQNKVLIKRTANMHYNLGVFYLNQKEYSRAVAEFEKAVELTPDDAYSHFNLGYIYAEYLVSRPKAIAHFRQYLRYAKKEDKDVDWVKKYLITWQGWQGKEPME